MNLAAREDPRAAAELYATLEAEASDPAWLEGMLDRIAALLRNEDPETALDWILPRRESGERSRALKETIGTWAITDLDGAEHWLVSERGDFVARPASNSTDSALVLGLVHRMAKVRPAAAVRWLARMGDVDDRDRMMMRIAHFWTLEAPAAVSAWIDTLEVPRPLEARLRDAVAKASRLATHGESGRSESIED